MKLARRRKLLLKRRPFTKIIRNTAINGCLTKVSHFLPADKGTLASKHIRQSVQISLGIRAVWAGYGVLAGLCILRR
jgi:hypothetical protein